MISRHKVTVRRNYHFRIGTLVLVSARDIIFVQQFAVYINSPGIDFDMVSGESHDALDETLRGIARITKDYDVSSLNRLQTVHKLIHEDTFLIFERRHHARAFDFDRLIEEDDDEAGNGQRDNKISQPHGEHQSSRATGRSGRVFRHSPGRRFGGRLEHVLSHYTDEPWSWDRLPPLVLLVPRCLRSGENRVK